MLYLNCCKLFKEVFNPRINKAIIIYYYINIIIAHFQFRLSADDIVLSSHDIEVLHPILRACEPVMLQAGLGNKPSKCAVFHDCTSANSYTKVEKMIYQK